MKLIDRYIHAVTEHLPQDVREDIAKELQGNIEDMLSEEASEEEVYQVLKELGNPRKLANEYNPRKKYLIGPGFYEQYIDTLKLVIGICIAVFVTIAILSGVVDMGGTLPSTKEYVKLMSSITSAVFEGALQGALWVTIVFIILERSGVEYGNTPFHKKEWTPEDLPDLPLQRHKIISRGDTIFEMCITVLFTAILYFNSDFIAIYEKTPDQTMNIIPLLNGDRLRVFIPFILVLAFLQLGLFVWKLLQGSWNISLAIGNSIYNLLSSLLLIVLVNDKMLVNREFLETLAGYFDQSEIDIVTFSASGVFIWVAVVLILCIWDSVRGFLKARNLGN